MVPFCHPKTIKFQKKIIPKMHQKKNDVCIEFLTILAPFWELSWGQISVKIGRRRGKQPYFLVRFFVFLTFSPSSPRGRGVPHRTAPILGGFWLHVGTIFGAMWNSLGARVGTGWAGHHMSRVPAGPKMTQVPAEPKMTSAATCVILGPAGTCVLLCCTGPRYQNRSKI